MCFIVDWHMNCPWFHVSQVVPHETFHWFYKKFQRIFMYKTFTIVTVTWLTRMNTRLFTLHNMIIMLTFLQPFQLTMTCKLLWLFLYPFPRQQTWHDLALPCKNYYIIDSMEFACRQKWWRVKLGMLMNNMHGAYIWCEKNIVKIEKTKTDTHIHTLMCIHLPGLVHLSSHAVGFQYKSKSSLQNELKQYT